MDTLTVARAFFDACDFGKGLDGCKQFCHSDASFETEAETLANIDTLAIYCDWMIDALAMLDKDVKVKVKAIAHDRDTDIVLIYGEIEGTVTIGPEPMPMKTDYVYALHFKKVKFVMYRKFGNSTYNR